MKFRISFNLSVLLTAALVGDVSIAQAFAQPAPRGGQGRGQGRGAMQGQQMGGMQNRMGGQMGSFGGMNGGLGSGMNPRGGQMPQVMGTITNGDARSGRLLLESPFDGSIHIVQVTGNTQIFTSSAVATTDLRIGDVVRVPNGGMNNGSGTATAESPSRAFRGNNANRRGSVGTNASGTNGTANAQNFNRPPQQQQGGAPPMLGRVTAVEPWTVAMESGQTTTLETNARASRIVTIAFSNLKVGDQVVAMGQPSSDGSFLAMTLAVNMNRGMGQNPMSINGQNRMPNGVQNAGSGQNRMSLPGGQRGGRNRR